MKTTIFILVILLCILQGSIIYAEQHTIVFPFDDHWVGSRGHPRPVTGEVIFEDTPRPLTPVKVRFSINPDETNKYFIRDASLYVAYDTNLIRVIGDTAWEVGVLEGEFSVVPLRSGSHGFSIGYRDQWLGRFEVRWCLSPVGECTYLGQEDAIKGRCDDSWCVFFDSVVVVKERLYNNPHVTKLFNYICSFDTIPQVGDTVELAIDMTFLLDAPKGVNMHVNTRGYNVITPPERLDRPITAGESVRLSFKVSPEQCQCVHRIGLTASAEGEAVHVSHRFVLEAVYDTNGDLLCISNRIADDGMKSLLGGDYMNEYLRGTRTILEIPVRGPKYDRVIINGKERMRTREQK